MRRNYRSEDVTDLGKGLFEKVSIEVADHLRVVKDTWTTCVFRAIVPLNWLSNPSVILLSWTADCGNGSLMV